MVAKSAKNLRIASSVLLALMMVFIFTSFYLQRLALTSRPAAPDPSGGYVHAVEIKGKVVFVNAVESLLVQWTFPASLLVGLAGGLLWVAADKRSDD